MHSREEDSLNDNQIDYNNLPKTNLNPTVQDFLQFEDSDDDDLGLIFKKHEVKAKQELQEQSLEAKPEPSQNHIELSPATRQKAQFATKNKTPAVATASEAGLQKIIKDAKTSEFMGPLDS